MKANIRLVLAVFFAALSVSAFGEVPKGFEDAKVLARVMKGEIVVDRRVDSKTQLQTVIRAYFNKVSPDAYLDLAVDHVKYPSMFKPDVEEAKTTSVNADRTVFTWWMNVRVKAGIFSTKVQPEGRQTIARAKDAVSESTMVNEITNFKADVNVGRETLRLIPYKGGFLLYDVVDVELVKANAQASMIKKELEKMFTRFVSTFRKELKGQY